MTSEQRTPSTQFEEGTTTRAADRFSDPMPAAYDEKDSMELLKEQLSKRKKPIYAGLAFLCVVVIAVSIAVSSGGGTEASTSSGYSGPTPTPSPTSSAPTGADAGASASAPSSQTDTAGGVHGADLSSSSNAGAGSSSKGSSAGSVAGEAALEEGLVGTNSSTPEPSSTSTSTSSPTPTPTPSPSPTTLAPTTPEPTTGPILPYKALDFDWKNPSLWEYSSGSPVQSGMFGPDGIKLTPSNSPQPIRTKQGWGGEKIVYIEWERSDSSDTNIWMLNTKLQDQFGKGNGWPYWGEIDIFEMFTQDMITQSAYDFTGFKQFHDVSSYGQLTLHNGPAHPAQPCFCPASPSKSSWYQNSAPMTSGCTAQFANTPKNSMATIWGSDGTGQYLQLYQNPTITMGGKVNGVQTYDITPGGTVTPKIYNNKDLFWGTPSSAPCAAAGGHNPSTGFPFFEDFRLILEEQKKNDGSAWFKVNNIQIFKK